MTIGAALMMLVFGCVLSYLAGRTDKRDLGPLRWRWPEPERPQLRLVPSQPAEPLTCAACARPLTMHPRNGRLYWCSRMQRWSPLPSDAA